MTRPEPHENYTVVVSDFDQLQHI